MNKKEAVKIIWDYMLLGHKLEKADAIVVLGSRDVRIAEYAAQLFLDGLAPILVFSGSGSIHNNKPGREQFINSSEAEVFTDIAINMGVPKESIIIENKSQNTGENYAFTEQKLVKHGIYPRTVIIIQKPYAERRAYATGKKHWPDLRLIVTSPQIELEDYPNEINNHNEHWLHSMVGDLERIRKYPTLGYQIEQEIPKNVWDAFNFLVSLGYTDKLIKS